MSDNNSKSLIEDTVKLLKLESKELNETVPGLPMSYGSVRTNRGLQDELARRQAMGRWSRSLGRKQEQKNIAGQGQTTTHPHRAHEAGQGGRLHPRNWASIDDYDQAGGYEKNETNESFSQYYGKATHHPMTKHGDPVQDSWNDQLRSRSGMMTQNNLKSYTEPYWNTTKTGPSTEKEFIDMHKVNGILDGEDYIKSTFDNINNSVPFKSHGRDNDASPTHDAQTILPQIHKNDEISPTDSMKRYKIAYEQVVHGNTQQLDEIFWGDPNITTSPKPGEKVSFTGDTSFWTGKKKFKREQPVGSDVYNQAKSMVSPGHVDKYVQDHQNNIDYSESAKNTVNKSLNNHINDMNEIAKAHDAITKTTLGLGKIRGGNSKSNIDGIVRMAKKGVYIRPNKFSMPQEYKGITGDSLRKHVGKLVDHIEYANEANAQHDRNIEANSDAISHLNKKNKDKNWHTQYINDHLTNATHQHLKAQLLDKDFDVHHKSANELRDTLGKGLGLNQQKTTFKLPRMGDKDTDSSVKDITKRIKNPITGEVSGIHPDALKHVPKGEVHRDDAADAEIAVQKEHVRRNPDQLLSRSAAEVESLKKIAGSGNVSSDERDSATAAHQQALRHHKKAQEAMERGDTETAVKSYGSVLTASAQHHMSQHGDSKATNEAYKGSPSTFRENLSHWSNKQAPDHKRGLIKSETKPEQGWSLPGALGTAALVATSVT